MKSWPVWDKPLLWNPQDPALEDEARLDLMGSAGQELCYKSLSLWWYVKKCRICFCWLQFLLLTDWVWMDLSYQRRIYLGACWEDECRVTFLLGQIEEIARLVSQIHMMLQAPYTWGWQELLNCIINFFDFSSCPLVVFGSANCPVFGALAVRGSAWDWHSYPWDWCFVSSGNCTLLGVWLAKNRTVLACWAEEWVSAVESQIFSLLLRAITC